MTETEQVPVMSVDEARVKLERAYRVQFDNEPDHVTQIIIQLGAVRVSNGETFHWEKKGNMPLLRYGLKGQESEESIKASDLLALESDEESQIVPDSKEVSEKPVSAKEAQFCRFIAAGDNQSTAYVKAGYTASTPNSAYVCSSQLMKRPRVAVYLRKLRESSYLANVLSLAEKRDFLAQVVRTPVGEIDEKHPLCQSYKVDTDGKVEYKAPDKLKALELDAKLAGELKEQPTTTNSFAFTLLGAGMDMGQVEAIDVTPGDGGALPE